MRRECGHTGVELREAVPSDAEDILAVQKPAFHGQGLLYNDLTLPPLVETLDDLVRDLAAPPI